MKISMELGATVKVKDSFYKLTIGVTELDPLSDVNKQIEAGKKGVDTTYQYLVGEIEERLMLQIEGVNQKVGK